MSLDRMKSVLKEIEDLQHSVAMIKDQMSVFSPEEVEFPDFDSVFEETFEELFGEGSIPEEDIQELTLFVSGNENSKKHLVNFFETFASKYVEGVKVDIE